MADPQADPVLDAMRQKLEMYEAAGMTEQVKSVKARIAIREKGAPKAPPAVSLTDVKPSVTAAPNVTVKKAAKKPARKR